MRKNFKELKSLFFIKDHFVELLKSEERTPLERAFSSFHTAMDWASGESLTIFGEVTSEYNDYIRKCQTYQEYLNYNLQEISICLYIYSIMISSNKELLDMVKSICIKNESYENSSEDKSDLIMIIEMLKTEGDAFKKRSKED